MEQIEIDARVTAKFAPFLDKFGHVWTSLDSSLDIFGQFWTSLDNSWQVWTTLDMFWQFQTCSNKVRQKRKF